MRLAYGGDNFIRVGGPDGAGIANCTNSSSTTANRAAPSTLSREAFEACSENAFTALNTGGGFFQLSQSAYPVISADRWRDQCWKGSGVPRVAARKETAAMRRRPKHP
jgi:hypothetical protein